MRLDLLAVYESGATRGASIPRDVRQSFSLPAGEDSELHFRVMDASGVPFDLSVGPPTITFIVKKRSTDPQRVLSIVAVADPTRGKEYATVTIPGSVSRVLLPGTYVWTLLRQLSTAYTFLVPTSELTVLPSLLQAL